MSINNVHYSFPADETSSMSQKPKDDVRELTTLQDPHSAVAVGPAPHSSLADDSTGPSPSEQKKIEGKSSGPDHRGATEQRASAFSKEAHGPFSKAHGQRSENGTTIPPDSNSKNKDGAVDTMLSESHSSSLLDDAADFVNEHLRAFRAIPWVLGGLGALLVIRYTHMVS